MMLYNDFEIEQFVKEHQDMILKEVNSLYGMGTLQRKTTKTSHVINRLLVSIGDVFIAVGMALKRHYGQTQSCKVNTHSRA